MHLSYLGSNHSLADPSARRFVSSLAKVGGFVPVLGLSPLFKNRLPEYKRQNLDWGDYSTHNILCCLLADRPHIDVLLSL